MLVVVLVAQVPLPSRNQTKKTGELMNSDVLTKVSDKHESFAGVIPHLKPGKLRCMESKLPNSKTAQNLKSRRTSQLSQGPVSRLK